MNYQHWTLKNWFTFFRCIKATFEWSTLKIEELVELFPESSAACQLLWDSPPIEEVLQVFAICPPLNSFTGCFVTHLHFLPPVSFPNCKSAPFLPLNCFQLAWKTNALQPFGFSPQIAGLVLVAGIFGLSTETLLNSTELRAALGNKCCQLSFLNCLATQQVTVMLV